METCASCGEHNPEGARFCSACGGALALQANRETHKTVTVLFADVTGSTALGEQLDPEALRRVMARYFEVAKGCIERHEGTVEKFIGDAVMAVFGVPAMHEDDALRALRAAAELRESLTALNGELERDYGVSLRVRTGVNTGEVVTGTEERLATGDAVNVAARLEQAAEPGEILIGEQTLRLARGAIEVEPVAPLTLKGKAKPVPAHRLLRVIEGAPAFERRLDASLVGRDSELMKLRAAFDAAVSERRCRLVTVFGPPGIGKSRLARELELALAGEASVLPGRCLAYGDGITYWPLVEIFRAAGGEDELAAALSAGAAEEIFWAVRKALELRARERPIALVIEDIHWAEPALLDFIQHLADWTRAAPLLLLCLSRPELRDDRPGWPGELITLEPLSDAQSDELIEELLHGSRLEPATRARIREVAEGNPLFVEQLLAMVAEGAEASEVPPTIQTLLASRLDALPADELEVLECASVVGLEFEWGALAALASSRRRPAGAQLAALVRKELIRPHDTLEDTFSFVHMLIRDAGYERVSRERRSELHERFAGWLDGRGEEFDAVIGYHLEQAYRCQTAFSGAAERGRALAEQAAARLAECGQRAYGRGDGQAAVNLLERAAGLFPADDPRRLSLLPSLGRALREEGEVDRADTVLSEAVERGLAAGDRGLAADAGVALVDLRFHRPAQTGVGREDVLQYLDEVVPIFAEVGDEAGLARALALGGKLRFWAGDSEAALRDLERSAHHAHDAGDRAQEAASLHYVLVALHRGPVPVGAALARFDELRPRMEANPRLRLVFLEVRSQLEAMAGDFSAARDSMSRARAIAEEHGLHVLLDSQMRPAAAYIELLAGDAEAAEAELRPACEGLERIGELGFLSSIAPSLVEALFLQGRHEEALAASDRWHPDRLTVPEDADAQVGWRRVRAKILACLGRFNEAERLGREAVEIASGTDFLESRAQALADLAEVLRFAGRLDESASVFDDALRMYERKGNAASAARLRSLCAEPAPAGLNEPPRRD